MLQVGATMMWRRTVFEDDHVASYIRGCNLGGIRCHMIILQDALGVSWYAAAMVLSME